ncbi:hypothetical protein [Buttiauxella sp. B2]|uniref:hypothetical protein n=1 Tax=Buttiauxella sp. B2 TaxID=2587812 RepID=UPI001CB8BF3D|nr:hypothetical protein [Buttiauxella sp. B2]
MIKLLLIMALSSLILTPAFAATAVRLKCSLRKNVLVSRFGYKLSTMKWDDNFQVASGLRKNHTPSGVPFEVTSFQNGDDLVYFPRKKQYVFFFRGTHSPDKCRITGLYTLPVTILPYHKNR